MKSASAACASASSTAACPMLPASARRTSTSAPLPTQLRTRSMPAGGRPRNISIWSTAAARSGTESTRVPSRSNITSCGRPPSNRRCRAVISALRLGQLGTHLVDYRFVVRRIEDRRTGDEGVSAGFGNRTDILHIHTTVDLQADIPTTGIDQSAGFTQLVEGPGDELLAAKAGVDAHQQHHVDLVHHVFQRVQRGRRIEYQSGLGTAILDQLQRAIHV